MSNSAASRLAKGTPEAASVFAALGDATRLALVGRLCDGLQHSISQLSKGSTLTRQAVTKHLRVLEDAGIVSRRKSGRERLYAYSPRALHDATRYMELVSRQWDQALGRLKNFVER